MKKLLLPLMLGALLTGCNETTTASNNNDFTAQQKTQIEQIASQRSEERRVGKEC